ncbi:MAG: hypothetical protein RDU83_13865 [bacterium]|nr:hypothetical protein [bacterium]
MAIPSLDGHDDILAVRGDELEELLRAGSEVLVDLDCPRLVEDTDVQGPGVKVNPAVS